MWESQLNEDITMDIVIVLFLFLAFIFNNIFTVTVKRRNKNGTVNLDRHFSSSSDVMSSNDCSCHFVVSSLLRMSQLCVQLSSVPVGLCP